MFIKTLGRLPAVAVVASAMLLPAMPASAAELTFTTAQSQFDAGQNNQGWWANFSDDVPDTTGDDYFVGSTDTSGGLAFEFRDFFTFDLSSLRDNVVAAQLQLRAGVSTFLPDGATSETLELFDVTTPAPILNHLNNDEGHEDPQIFADLGTGVSYGTFVIKTTDEQAILTLNLNTAGVTAINANRGSFFSVGGRVITLFGALFGFTESSFGPNATKLVVHTANVPTTKDSCKKGRWRNLVDAQGHPFKNQGQCVSWAARHL